jgi:2-haloacid dehalogenase
MRLSDFKVLTFDCYGTLIDWESGMLAGLHPLTTAAAAKLGKPLARNAILEAHARHEAAAQKQTPAKLYRDLLAVVYKRLAEEWGVPVGWIDCEDYGRSVGSWPAFADSSAALTYLKRHFKLVILSNVDNRSFGLSNARLGVTFDAIYTAEDIGSYKPDARNFDYMIDNLARLDFAKGTILHTAESLFHDHAPANAAGLASCWIYRRHDQEGSGATPPVAARPHTDFVFTSMAELAAAHRVEESG